MAHGARGKISRRNWLLAGLAIPVFRAHASVNLSVFFDGDNLHVAAPQLHFLSGKSLTRLQDGLTLAFVSQLTLLREDRSTIFRRSPERILVSYDVWEEKYKVTLGSERSAKDLTLGEAESWCLENLAISALGLPPERPFWLRFDLRSTDPKELSQVMGDPGISLRGLIELFGRKPGADEWRSTLEAGPLRLTDLPRRLARGTRNG